ncbi:MAG: hypothetical protein O0V67_06955 [Methanocorpusculum sp.]|nr:hypothetical protein [Methanocorpusculum sp.]
MTEAKQGIIRSLFVRVGMVDAVTGPLMASNNAVNQYVGHAKAAEQQTVKLSATTVTAADAQLQLETAAGKSAAQIELEKRAMEQAKREADQFRSSLMAVGAALTAVGVAGALYFSSQAREFATYSGGYGILSRNVGEDTDRLLQQMKEATGGTVAAVDMVKSANRAIAFGIEAETLPQLAEIAEAAARIQGGDTTAMFNDIVTGIARQSQMILDNLGIVVSVGEANQMYAESLGVAVDALTEEQQVSAMLYAVLEKSNVLLDMAGEKQKSLGSSIQASTAAVKDMNVAIAGGAAPAMQVWYDSVTALANAVSGLPEPVLGVIGVVGAAGTAVMGLTGSIALQIVAVNMLISQFSTLGIGLGSILPASIAATGGITGLTASLSAGAVAAWAFMSPFLPLIAVIGAIIGACWLLWDVAQNGWDDSVLGKFLNWLGGGILPYLQVGFTGLSDAVQGFVEWVTSLPETIKNTWDTVTNHPLWPFVEWAFRLSNPVGWGITLAQAATGTLENPLERMQQSVQTLTEISNSSSSTALHETYNITINPQSLSPDELDAIIDEASKKGARAADVQLLRRVRASMG